MELIIALTILLIVVGTPVTLLWWHLANKWASGEHAVDGDDYGDEHAAGSRTGSRTGQVIAGSARAPRVGRSGRSARDAPTVIRIATTDTDAEHPGDAANREDRAHHEP